MKVTDPVCKMTIEDGEAAATSNYKGKTYYSCSKHCKEAFDKALSSSSVNKVILSRLSFAAAGGDSCRPKGKGGRLYERDDCLHKKDEMDAATTKKIKKDAGNQTKYGNPAKERLSL